MRPGRLPWRVVLGYITTWRLFSEPSSRMFGVAPEGDTRGGKRGASRRDRSWLNYAGGEYLGLRSDWRRP
jgi:hypothetical protein